MPANYIFPLKRFHKLSTVPLLWQMEAVLDLTPKVREDLLKKVLFRSCQNEYFLVLPYMRLQLEKLARILSGHFEANAAFMQIYSVRQQLRASGDKAL